MPIKLSADGITAQGFVNYAKGWYNANVKGASIQYSKGAGAQMAVVDWKPYENDQGDPVDNPSTVRQWIMVSGMSKAGEPLSTNRWMDAIDALALKRDYTCCGQIGSKRPMSIGKDGKYYCPHCNKIAKVDVDANDDYTLPWNDLKARILLDIRKVEGSDDERNSVLRVVPLTR